MHADRRLLAFTQLCRPEKRGPAAELLPRPLPSICFNKGIRNGARARARSGVLSRAQSASFLCTNPLSFVSRFSVFFARQRKREREREEFSPKVLLLIYISYLKWSLCTSFHKFKRKCSGFYPASPFFYISETLRVYFCHRFFSSRFLIYISFPSVSLALYFSARRAPALFLDNPLYSHNSSLWPLLLYQKGYLITKFIHVFFFIETRSFLSGNSLGK